MSGAPSGWSQSLDGERWRRVMGIAGGQSATGRHRGVQLNHVVHWIHGGATDLDNLILLCHRHHWKVHEGNWQIVCGEDGCMLTIPPAVSFGPWPRGPD